MRNVSKTNTKAKRLQVPMDAETMRTLAELKTAVGARSVAALVRDALKLYAALQQIVHVDKRQLATIDEPTGFIHTLYIPSLMQDTPIIAVDVAVEKMGKKK